MNKIELIGELFLVREQRSLRRNNPDDRLIIASEIVAMFERLGLVIDVTSRPYYVDSLCSSVPFVRFICGAAVFGRDLLVAANLPTDQ